MEGRKFICEGREVKISAKTEIFKTLGSSICYPKLGIIYCDFLVK